MIPDCAQISRHPEPISVRELDAAHHAVRVLEKALHAISDYAIEQKTPSAAETLKIVERLLEQSRARYETLLLSPQPTLENPVCLNGPATARPRRRH
jgi:hypothetical protein